MGELFDRYFDPGPAPGRVDEAAVAGWRAGRQRLTGGLSRHLAFEIDATHGMGRWAEGMREAADGRRIADGDWDRIAAVTRRDWFEAYNRLFGDRLGPDGLNTEEWLLHEAATGGRFTRPSGPDPAARLAASGPPHDAEFLAVVPRPNPGRPARRPGADRQPDAAAVREPDPGRDARPRPSTVTSQRAEPVDNRWRDHPVLAADIALTHQVLSEVADGVVASVTARRQGGTAVRQEDEDTRLCVTLLEEYVRAVAPGVRMRAVRDDLALDGADAARRMVDRLRPVDTWKALADSVRQAAVADPAGEGAARRAHAMVYGQRRTGIGHAFAVASDGRTVWFVDLRAAPGKRVSQAEPSWSPLYARAAVFASRGELVPAAEAPQHPAESQSTSRTLLDPPLDRRYGAIGIEVEARYPLRIQEPDGTLTRPLAASVLAEHHPTGFKIVVESGAFWLGPDGDLQSVVPPGKNPSSRDFPEIITPPFAVLPGDIRRLSASTGFDMLDDVWRLLGQVDTYHGPLRLSQILPEGRINERGRRTEGWFTTELGEKTTVFPAPDGPNHLAYSQITVGIPARRLLEILEFAEPGLPEPLAFVFETARRFGRVVAAGYASESAGRQVDARDVDLLLGIESVTEIWGYAWLLFNHVAADSLAQRIRLNLTKNALPAASHASFSDIHEQLTPRAREYFDRRHDLIRDHFVRFFQLLSALGTGTSTHPVRGNDILNETIRVSGGLRVGQFLTTTLRGHSQGEPESSPYTTLGMTEIGLDDNEGHLDPPLVLLELRRLSGASGTRMSTQELRGAFHEVSDVARRAYERAAGPLAMPGGISTAAAVNGILDHPWKSGFSAVQMLAGLPLPRGEGARRPLPVGEREDINRALAAFALNGRPLAEAVSQNIQDLVSSARGILSADAPPSAQGRPQDTSPAVTLRLVEEAARLLPFLRGHSGGTWETHSGGATARVWAEPVPRPGHQYASFDGYRGADHGLPVPGIRRRPTAGAAGSAGRRSASPVREAWSGRQPAGPPGRDRNAATASAQQGQPSGPSGIPTPGGLSRHLPAPTVRPVPPEGSRSGSVLAIPGGTGDPDRSRGSVSRLSRPASVVGATVPPRVRVPSAGPSRPSAAPTGRGANPVGVSSGTTAWSQAPLDLAGALGPGRRDEALNVLDALLKNSADAGVQVNLEQMTAWVLHLDPRTRVGEGEYERLLLLVEHAGRSGQSDALASFDALSWYYLARSGLLQPRSEISGPPGRPGGPAQGRNWTPAFVAGFDLSTVIIPRHGDGLRPSSDHPVAAPWSLEGDGPYVVRAEVEHDRVVVHQPAVPTGRLYLTYRHFAGLLTLDPLLRERHGAAVVLAGSHMGAGNLDLPRTVAAITRRDVYASTGEVRLETGFTGVARLAPHAGDRHQKPPGMFIRIPYPGPLPTQDTARSAAAGRDTGGQPVRDSQPQTQPAPAAGTFPHAALARTATTPGQRPAFPGGHQPLGAAGRGAAGPGPRSRAEDSGYRFLPGLNSLTSGSVPPSAAGTPARVPRPVSALGRSGPAPASSGPDDSSVMRLRGGSGSGRGAVPSLHGVVERLDISRSGRSAAASSGGRDAGSPVPGRSAAFPEGYRGLGDAGRGVAGGGAGSLVGGGGHPVPGDRRSAGPLSGRGGAASVAPSAGRQGAGATETPYLRQPSPAPGRGPTASRPVGPEDSRRGSVTAPPDPPGSGARGTSHDGRRATPSPLPSALPQRPSARDAGASAADAGPSLFSRTRRDGYSDSPLPPRASGIPVPAVRPVPALSPSSRRQPDRAAGLEPPTTGVPGRPPSRSSALPLSRPALATVRHRTPGPTPPAAVALSGRANRSSLHAALHDSARIKNVNGQPDAGPLDPDLFGLLKPSPAPAFLVDPRTRRPYDHTTLTADQQVRYLRLLDLTQPRPDTAAMNPARWHVPEGDDSVSGTLDSTRWAPTTRDDERLPSLTVSVPLLVHAIWVGSPLRDHGPSAGFWENYREAAVDLGEKATFVLWTDVPRDDFTNVRDLTQEPAEPHLRDVWRMARWADEAEIVLVSPFEVFHQDRPMRLHREMLTELAKHNPRGWAAFSDGLRLEILHAIGGLYSDGDNAVENLNSFDQVVETPAFATYADRHRFGNSAFAAPAGHPFITQLLNQLAENYRKSQPELYGPEEILLGREGYFTEWTRARRNSVLLRTGPESMRPVARHFGYSSARELPSIDGIFMGDDVSWLQTPVPPPQSTWTPVATLAFTQRVVHTMVRSLYNRNGDLHLTEIDSAVRRHPRPTEIWEAALGFIADRDDLRSRVRSITTEQMTAHGQSVTVQLPGIVTGFFQPASRRAQLGDGNGWWLGERARPVDMITPDGLAPTGQDGRPHGQSRGHDPSVATGPPGRLRGGGGIRLFPGLRAWFGRRAVSVATSPQGLSVHSAGDSQGSSYASSVTGAGTRMVPVSGMEITTSVGGTEGLVGRVMAGGGDLVGSALRGGGPVPGGARPGAVVFEGAQSAFPRAAGDAVGSEDTPAGVADGADPLRLRGGSGRGTGGFLPSLSRPSGNVGDGRSGSGGAGGSGRRSSLGVPGVTPPALRAPAPVPDVAGAAGRGRAGGSVGDSPAGAVPVARRAEHARSELSHPGHGAVGQRSGQAGTTVPLAGFRRSATPGALDRPAVSGGVGGLEGRRRVNSRPLGSGDGSRSWSGRREPSPAPSPAVRPASAVGRRAAPETRVPSAGPSRPPSATTGRVAAPVGISGAAASPEPHIDLIGHLGPIGRLGPEQRAEAQRILDGLRRTGAGELVSLEQVARGVLHLNPRTPVDEGEYERLLRLVVHATGSGTPGAAESLATLSWWYQGVSGVRLPWSEIPGRPGGVAQGRNWTSTPVTGLDLSTVIVPSPGHEALSTADRPVEAPWSAEGIDPYVVRAEVEHDRVVVHNPAAPAGRLYLTYGQFAGLLARDPLLRDRPGASVVLAGSRMGAGDLDLPRAVAATTRRHVYASAGEVRLVTSGFTGATRLAPAAGDRSGHVTGIFARFPYPGPSPVRLTPQSAVTGFDTGQGWTVVPDSRLRTDPIVSRATNNTIGRASHSAQDWPAREPLVGDLDRVQLFLQRSRRITRSQVLPWVDGPAPYFFSAHGIEGYVRMERRHEGPIIVDGTQVGGWLRRRPSVSSLPSDVPIVLNVCDAGVSNALTLRSVAQGVADATGRTVYAAEAIVTLQRRRMTETHLSPVETGLNPSPGGLAAQWLEFRPEPSGEHLDALALAAGMADPAAAETTRRLVLLLRMIFGASAEDRPDFRDLLAGMGRLERLRRSDPVSSAAPLTREYLVRTAGELAQGATAGAPGESSVVALLGAARSGLTNLPGPPTTDFVPAPAS
ncbi:lonely Cys domain-containing protein [Streptomyces mirabilis]